MKVHCHDDIHVLETRTELAKLIEDLWFFLYLYFYNFNFFANPMETTNYRENEEEQEEEEQQQGLKRGRTAAVEALQTAIVQYATRPSSFACGGFFGSADELEDAITSIVVDSIPANQQQDTQQEPPLVTRTTTDDVSNVVSIHTIDTEAGIASLMSKCTPSKFRSGNVDVYDPSYRNAVELKAHQVVGLRKRNGRLFCLEQDQPQILEVLRRTFCVDKIRLVPFKLNVYSTGGFFNAHCDTPVNPQMVGTLVLCLRTAKFEGGQLRLCQRSTNTDYTFDWSTSQNETENDAWGAFFGDCEHQVNKVTNGHRITFTWQVFADPSLPAQISSYICVPDELKKKMCDALHEIDTECVIYKCVHAYADEGGSFFARRRQTVFENLSQPDLVLKGVDALVFAAMLAVAPTRPRWCTVDQQFGRDVYGIDERLKTCVVLLPPVDDEGESRIRRDKIGAICLGGIQRNFLESVHLSMGNGGIDTRCHYQYLVFVCKTFAPRRPSENDDDDDDDIAVFSKKRRNDMEKKLERGSFLKRESDGNFDISFSGGDELTDYVVEDEKELETRNGRNNLDNDIINELNSVLGSRSIGGGGEEKEKQTLLQQQEEYKQNFVMELLMAKTELEKTGDLYRYVLFDEKRIPKALCDQLPGFSYSYEQDEYELIPTVSNVDSVKYQVYTHKKSGNNLENDASVKKLQTTLKIKRGGGAGGGGCSATTTTTKTKTKKMVVDMDDVSPLGQLHCSIIFPTDTVWLRVHATAYVVGDDAGNLVPRTSQWAIHSCEFAGLGDCLAKHESYCEDDILYKYDIRHWQNAAAVGADMIRAVDHTQLLNPLSLNVCDIHKLSDGCVEIKTVLPKTAVRTSYCLVKVALHQK